MLSIQAIKELNQMVMDQEKEIDSYKQLQKTQEARLKMLEQKLNYLLQNLE